MEKEIELFGRMWGTVKEWQDLYNGWKGGKFRDIEVGSW